MKSKSLSKTKFNIAWVSVVTIFIGAIVYVPVLNFSEKDREVVYYKVPVYVNLTPVNQAPETEVPQPEKPEKEEPVKKANILITKNLKLGDDNAEVKLLQEFLNSRGFLVAESGPGSIGQETTRFGRGTQDALIKFQEFNSELILKPFGLTQGTGIVGEMTRKLINS